MAYTVPGNISTSVGMFQWINTVTDSWFFPGMILAVFIIILVKMLFNESNSTSKSFAAASFMTMIITVFARVLDFVSTGFMTLFIIFTAAGAVWMHMENASN